MGLRDLLSPLSPTAAQFEDMAQVVRQYSRLVKRFPNPSYTDRRSGSGGGAGRSGRQDAGKLHRPPSLGPMCDALSAGGRMVHSLYGIIHKRIAP